MRSIGNSLTISLAEKSHDSWAEVAVERGDGGRQVFKHLVPLPSNRLHSETLTYRGILGIRVPDPRYVRVCEALTAFQPARSLSVPRIPMATWP